jgi:release factor glutamine methyltransferase
MRFDDSDHSAPPLSQYVQLPVGIRVRRRIRPILFRMVYPVHLYLNRHARQKRINGLVLRIEPQVFDPGRHFTSKILARYVRRLNLAGCRLLDMGTGTGIIGIAAAKEGARVTAVDVNPAAVQLATTNANVLGVGNAMRVLYGDLFSSIPAVERFDWMVFNPPFFPRPATHPLEAAYNAGEKYAVISRFLQEARGFLAPAGRILLILSSDMNLSELQAMFDQGNYRIAQCDITPHLFELFYLVQLQPIEQGSTGNG